MFYLVILGGHLNPKHLSCPRPSHFAGGGVQGVDGVEGRQSGAGGLDRRAGSPSLYMASSLLSRVFDFT